MAVPDKNYTKGSGRLMFRAFLPGTKVPAEGAPEYIGNTPSVSLSNASESLDHFDSDSGTNEMDASIDLSTSRTGSFTTDHVSPGNLARFFGGSAEEVTLVGSVGLSEQFAGVLLDRRYQVGVSANTPAGVRNLGNVAVSVAAAAKVEGVDYTLDAETGGITFLSSGSIAADATVDVDYDVVAGEFSRVITGESRVEGELTYISTNRAGHKFDKFWPHVVLRPDGEYELKSDEWQQLGFTFTALKRDDATAVMYINGRAA